MLTNDKSASLDLNSLRNKKFFLDTNIIYRGLGINGKLRQKRTFSLLSKFNAIGEKLIISKITENEFYNSIKYYIERIDRYENPKISAKAYLDETIYSHEFYSFYQEWRLNRKNTSLDLFTAYVEAEYENFKKKFCIEEDHFPNYDLQNEETQKILDAYKQGIAEYKPKAYEGKIAHDAKIILWIETLTKERPQNIYEAKAFLLSSDHHLQTWDYSRDAKVPYVFLPSQWLSVSLRFIERTNDDYASFVSFLNLPIQERLLDQEQLLAIISGISEYTSDYASQSAIFRNFVNIRTEKALASQKAENLKDESKQFAKSQLELELSKNQQNIADLQHQVEQEKKAREEINTEKVANENVQQEKINMLTSDLRKKDDTITTIVR